ncbi:tryptophan 2,3-dioxygenase family protein [Streptomyces marincola]|uniref:Tryptophan 2,3-dioxygenase n=1 Tax=Streptomyces marincola TaxID=2878388 RepID=A0A1W7D0X7_9ACTN|nr:tryptophan 2,3-dioxygenase family protein [Streptomyces marincola]ARQ70559.1 hypothetical protein CAG99_18445 [Streptomyces marincola]
MTETADVRDDAAGRAGGPDSDLTYARYLRIPELLSLQVPSAARVHDERLFITVHQTQELWFAQLLAELDDARDLMLDGEPRRARLRIARCLEIGRTLIDGLRPLRTMPAGEFLAFRGRLGTASGAQSAQYREIEVVSGAAWADREALPEGLSDAEAARLRRRHAEPNLWDGFLSVLRKCGFGVATPAGRRAALDRIAGRPDAPDPVGAAPGPDALPRLGDLLGELAELATALLDYDTMWAEWRTAHILLVERQIGARTGTGGSSGAPHLRMGVGRRFFPELWDAVAPGPLAAVP